MNTGDEFDMHYLLLVGDVIVVTSGVNKTPIYMS